MEKVRGLSNKRLPVTVFTNFYGLHDMKITTPKVFITLLLDFHESLSGRPLLGLWALGQGGPKAFGRSHHYQHLYCHGNYHHYLSGICNPHPYYHHHDYLKTTWKLENLRTPLPTQCPRAKGRAGQGIPKDTINCPEKMMKISHDQRNQCFLSILR